jgi:hypothetical protein
MEFSVAAGVGLTALVPSDIEEDGSRAGRCTLKGFPKVSNDCGRPQLSEQEHRSAYADGIRRAELLNLPAEKGRGSHRFFDSEGYAASRACRSRVRKVWSRLQYSNGDAPGEMVAAIRLLRTNRRRHKHKQAGDQAKLHDHGMQNSRETTAFSSSIDRMIAHSMPAPSAFDNEHAFCAIPNQKPPKIICARLLHCGRFKEYFAPLTRRNKSRAEISREKTRL